MQELRECLSADAGLSFDGGALQVGSDDLGLPDMAAPGIADGGKRTVAERVAA